MLRFLSGSVKSGSCGSDFLETILLVEECVSKKVVHTSDLNTELRNCAAQVADFWTGRVGETVAICLMFILDDDFTCKKVRITKLQGCRFVPYTFFGNNPPLMLSIFQRRCIFLRTVPIASMGLVYDIFTY